MSALGLLLLLQTTFSSVAAERTKIHWDGKLPKKSREDLAEEAGAELRKPLLVYVTQSTKTQDQERFDNVVESIAQFKLATKFFERVKIPITEANKSVFLEGIRIQAPAILVFGPDRSTYKMSAGRPSAGKAVAIMRRVGQPAWETDMKKTLQQAKVLLARYVQIDAAQNAIDIKKRRHDDAAAKGEQATARALQADLDRDVGKREKYLEETDKLWKELWTLKRRVRDG